MIELESLVHSVLISDISLRHLTNTDCRSRSCGMILGRILRKQNELKGERDFCARDKSTRDFSGPVGGEMKSGGT